MRGALRNTCIRLAALVAIAAVAGVWSCTSSPPNPRSELDDAVKDFVDGDYQTAVKKLEWVVTASTDDAVRREAYTYLGRSHMALGETDLAVEAFSSGVQLGDRGPCVAYLEVLKQYMEGKPNALHMSDVLTRSQLAGAVVRLFLGESTEVTGGPTPMTQLERRGWMPVLPDGQDHAADPVTRATLYMLSARILSETNQTDELDRIMPGGYRAATKAQAPVTGAEGLAILERVRAAAAK